MNVDLLGAGGGGVILLLQEGREMVSRCTGPECQTRARQPDVIDGSGSAWRRWSSSYSEPSLRENWQGWKGALEDGSRKQYSVWKRPRVSHYPV